MLQDTGAAIYDSTETGYWIEECLKDAALCKARDFHTVPVVFKIESRTGRDTTGTASSLTDTTKSQFVATDDDDEKVVHNTTDNTWAVVKTYTSSSVLVLSADIMASGEDYEIYNKRCWNKKQIYIGDVTDYLDIDSVEYPIGQKRNFKVYGDVLELKVDDSVIEDSDTTLTTLSDVNVLVRFIKPHRLCQLADVDGAVHTEGAAAATTLQVKSFTDTQIVEIGDEFHITGHKATYTITASVTLANQATTGSTLTFYPGLEAVASADVVVTFVQSTLPPHLEELFCHLVVTRAIISEANARLVQARDDLASGRLLLNTVPLGGTQVPGQYIEYARAESALAIGDRDMGERKLAEVLAKLRSVTKPETKMSYPKD